MPRNIEQQVDCNRSDGFRRQEEHARRVIAPRVVDSRPTSPSRRLLERRSVPHQKTAYLLTGLLKCGCCGGLMQISGGSPHRYCRCVSNRKRGVCGNRLSVRESLARERILEAIHCAVASPDAAAYVRHRLAERMGALSRESGADLTERSGRLKRSRSASAASS
jgi:Recombinase zinc beta ribbon domain